MTDAFIDIRAAILSAGASFIAVLVLMGSSGFGIDGIGAGSFILMKIRCQSLLLLPFTDSAKVHSPRLSSLRSTEVSRPEKVYSLLCNQWECSGLYCLPKSAPRS